MTDDVIERAKKKFKQDKSHWSEIYEKGKEDLHFLSDDKYAQWDQKDIQDRESTGRPLLTIDQLGQFVHQVANDIRQNTPSINILPVGDGADVDTADLYKGIIKGIEYDSSADDATDYAVTHAIKSGIGFIRISNEFVDEESIDQKLCIDRVINPFAVFLDAESIEPDGSDAKHCTILEKIKKSQFEARWPGKDADSFDDEGGKKTYSRKRDDDEQITIAEFFEIEETEKIVALDMNGRRIKQYQEGMPVLKTRKVKEKTVKRYILSGSDILEETVFPGKYIPIVPVYGEEAWVEGKRNLFSLIRKSKGAQRMYNYYRSLETELLMKQPNAPVMVAVGQIEDFAADWKDPAKSMALRYKQTDSSGNPAPPPQRLEPPTIPTGIVNAAREMVDDIKSTMGIYNAALGQQSNETSGKAIMARQREGDVATFHYSDNLMKSVTQVGRILVCAIPVVYDTARIIHMMDAEGNPKMVGINGQMVDNQERPFDLSQGKYSVRVVTGASYTTQRQESAEFFNNLIQQNPQMVQVAGDLMFKAMDFPGAQELAARMKKLVDPKLLSDEDKAKVQTVDPEKEQMAQIIQQGQGAIEQMQQQIAQLEQQLKDKQAENAIKIESEQAKVETERMKLVLEKKKLELEQQKITIEAQKSQHEQQMREVEVMMAQQQPQQQPEAPEMGAEQPEQETGVEEVMAETNNLRVKQAEMQQQVLLTNAIVDSVNQLSQVVLTPKPIRIIRDPLTGLIQGAE